MNSIAILRILYTVPQYNMEIYLLGDNENTKLLGRIKRIRGQLDSIERSLGKGSSPFAILQTAAACRGAMSGLMAVIIEKRIRDSASLTESSDADDLIEIVRAYLK